jgi:hypothetical protein
LYLILIQFRTVVTTALLYMWYWYWPNLHDSIKVDTDGMHVPKT